MKYKKEKESFSNYSKKQLNFYKVIFLFSGIFLLISGCLLSLVSLVIGLFSIAIGILSIYFSKKFKSELIKRKGMMTVSNSIKASAESGINVKSLDSTVKERHSVAGTSFKQTEIKSLGVENDYYSMTKKELIEECMENENIYQLDFLPNLVELVEDPTNKHDPNAIKVIIDDVHVGYIKKGSCAHVKKLLRENKIRNITSDIHGGKYKRISCEYDIDSDKDVYELETGETDFFVSISLELKPE